MGVNRDRGRKGAGIRGIEVVGTHGIEAAGTCGIEGTGTGFYKIAKSRKNKHNKRRKTLIRNGLKLKFYFFLSFS